MVQTAQDIARKPARRFARTPAKAPPAEKSATATKKRRPASPPIMEKAVKPQGTKTATIVALLARTDGVTIAQLCEATGWQPHSVRGFLAGTVRKKMDRGLTSEKTDGIRVYRLAGEETKA